MRRSYKGLFVALKTAEYIVKENEGLDWASMVRIFSYDPNIEPYYYEVVDALMSGRSSLRFEKWGETMNTFDIFLILYGLFVLIIMTYIAYKGNNRR